MRSRFQIDDGVDEGTSPAGLENYDAAAGEFAARAEQSESAGRFVAEDESEELEAGTLPEPHDPVSIEADSLQESRDEIQAEKTDEDWRDEIAARVNSYRERRGSKEPRYPSLRLKFEGHEPSWKSSATRPSALSASGTAALSLSASARVAEIVPDDASAKIIEFPRSLIVPTITDELAEPVLDRPRIIEAPELVPPPPALGGISIEQSEEQHPRDPIDLPLQPASITRRLMATLIDGVIVSTASALFACIFFRVTADQSAWSRPHLVLAALPLVFWFSFQYLFVVHSGRTPGTALTKIGLRTFAGEPATRNLRRWRVLTSLLSAVSLGLGYGWCFMDEDQLCWHDRITHTYLAPQRSDKP